MSLILYGLTQACENLSIKYQILDTNANLIQIYIDGAKKYFANCSVPLNNASAVKICIDKGFTDMILKGIVKMPESYSYFDPFSSIKRYKQFVREKSYEAIVEDITKKLKFPLVVKMNSGKMKINFYICHNEKDVLEAIKNIFNHKSKNYDYIALAQEFIEIKEEFRVTVLFEEVEFVFKKKGLKIISDEIFLNKIRDFLKPIYNIIPLQYAGIDIATDQQGNLVLIEINSAPGYREFVKKNGNFLLIKMYEKILNFLK